MALTNKLSAIGDAIRAKTGGTELLTLDEMPVAINSIEAGGGGEELPEEAFTITGECPYRFGYGGWDWFIENYGSRVTTSDIRNAQNMFYLSHVKVIPFAINGSTVQNTSCMNMFSNCSIEEVPEITYLNPSQTTSMFLGCQYLREVDLSNVDWSYMNNLTSAYSGQNNAMFSSCRSLRSVKGLNAGNPNIYYSYALYKEMFRECNALDEVTNLPVNHQTTAVTSNMFDRTFTACFRLKNMTFEVNDDGTPKIAMWANQTLDLSDCGYEVSNYLLTSDAGRNSYFDRTYLLTFNSGITTDKFVYDDATYAALKDDPDWFTACDAATNSIPEPWYSRYNHDSAVATINSLPDCSATGVNIIRFYGAAGEKTDGGAINTLTEEEIAVATAKGWTVTLV